MNRSYSHGIQDGPTSRRGAQRVLAGSAGSCETKQASTPAQPGMHAASQSEQENPGAKKKKNWCNCAAFLLYFSRIHDVRCTLVPRATTTPAVHELTSSIPVAAPTPNTSICLGTFFTRDYLASCKQRKFKGTIRARREGILAHRAGKQAQEHITTQQLTAHSTHQRWRLTRAPTRGWDY